MIVLFLLLVLISCFGMKLSSWNNDYISKPVTDSIKGIFAIIIIYSHMRGYLPPPSDSYAMTADSIFHFLINLIGQLMVVMFLFYSGYGIMESNKLKREYTKSFISKRVLKTLFNFDIAVILYALLALIIGKEYEMSKYFWSIIGWESIGNSNWFVFDILILYIVAYFCLLARRKFNIAISKYFMLIYGLCGIFIIFLYITKHLTYWYDTILALPTGMLYSEYKNQIEKVLKRYYWISLLIVLLLFVSTYLIGNHVKVLFNAIFFSLLIVTISVKIKLDNRVLRWLGINCFAIYILQRIPMIIYSELGLNNNWLLFVICVIPTTLFLAAVFTAFTNRLNKRLFN